MTTLSYVYVFIFGAITGSFLNCLIWRLHKKESLLGRSYCPKCQQQIAWYDNFPIFSYLFLGGKCRHCKKNISIQYPLVELICALLFTLAFYNNFQFSFIAAGQASVDHKLILNLIKDWFVIAVMIIIFIYDLRWYLILDSVSLPACLVIFALNLLAGDSWQNLLISGIIGGSFFLIQFVISKGKWIGGGDIRLGLLIGLILGWPNVLVAIFIAYFIGSIVGVGLIISGRKKWGSKVPMGIFLTVATIIALFWGDIIMDWYLNVLKIG